MSSADQKQQLHNAIATLDTGEDSALRERLNKLETFMARRFDEISMEINATSQLLGMAEEGMSQRFSDILGALGSISYKGDGSTPANTGVELQAVIKTAEEAANTILDAADKMSSLLHTLPDPKDEDARRAYSDAMSQSLQEIVLACAFQDLVSQRVCKALQNIEEVETNLDTTLQNLGIKVEHPAPDAENSATRPKLSSQDDIDSLFD